MIRKMEMETNSGFITCLKMSVQQYIQRNIPFCNRRILGKFRTGSLPLEVELDNYCKPKVELIEFICKLCTIKTGWS